MTRSRRDGDHDDDDAKPISDEEVANAEANAAANAEAAHGANSSAEDAERPTPAAVLAIEGLRWVYSPGVTVLQYLEEGHWHTVPSVTLAEAEAEEPAP
jgi:hypothetical protein